jgi:heme exporter protein B
VKAFWTLLQHDLKAAFQTGDGALFKVCFFLLIVFIALLGVESENLARAGISAQAGSGIIWVSALLVSLLSLDQIFVRDAHNGVLDQLVLTALPLELVAMAKILAHWLATGFILAVVSGFLAVIIGIEGDASLMVVVALLIGTPALSFIGAMGSAFMVFAGYTPFLLAFLIMPFYIPTLIFGTLVVVEYRTGGNYISTLFLEAAVTVFVVTIFPFITASILRAGIRE